MATLRPLLSKNQLKISERSSLLLIPKKIMDMPDLARNQSSSLNSKYTSYLCRINNKKQGSHMALHVSSGVFCAFQDEKTDFCCWQIFTIVPSGRMRPPKELLQKGLWEPPDTRRYKKDLGNFKLTDDRQNTSILTNFTKAYPTVRLSLP